MSHTKQIPVQFYETLFTNSVSISREAGEIFKKCKNKEALISDITDRRTENGLAPQTSGLLLQLLNTQNRDPSENQRLRQIVLDKARTLREQLYGHDVAVMVPIEISSFCASNCSFCGWRSDNKDMVRLKISPSGIEKEIESLSHYGFSHYEIVAGDDLNFIKNDLEGIIKLFKSKLKELNTGARVSICLTPLLKPHYETLKKAGLDTVLTWQETYNFENYRKLITSGPKANGITTDFKVAKNEDGCLMRMSSHEVCVQTGLQVGLGVMLGLDETDPEADILSAIQHANKLIETYRDTIQPIIIGMPIWNPITTARTDNSVHHKSKVSGEEDFELISAIYLLSLPDRFAWVFPNCRVSKKTQLESIKTAGCFTSGMVRVGPGAYLNFDKKVDFTDTFVKSSEKVEALTQEKVLTGEQFQHHFDSQENYNKRFKEENLIQVKETKFLAELIQKEKHRKKKKVA